MKISFLGQGFESQSEKSVGNHIINFFKQNKFNSFTGISAFASEAGVEGLSQCISAVKNSYKSLNLIVGIDQEGTSEQALRKIKQLDINSYIFYQKESPIFHPKIYLFEGEKETALIIGSSNLTARGLFGNVESSLMVEFRNNNLEGQKLIGEVKEYYKSLFDFSDKNLFEISDGIIGEFLKKGIVPTKKVWKKKHQKNTADEITESNDSLVIPKRMTAKIPSIFRGRYKTDNTVSKLIAELEIDNKYETELKRDDQALWISGPLTERDLNIPKGKNTNPTGSMLLKKGLLEGIDQRHHFRNNVFSSLVWRSEKSVGKKHIERAVAQIRFLIEGIDYGIFPILISHNTRTDTASYKQKNSMTQLSWGETKKLIAQDELIGKTAKLYKDKTSNNNFILMIE